MLQLCLFLINCQWLHYWQFAHEWPRDRQTEVYYKLICYFKKNPCKYDMWHYTISIISYIIQLCYRPGSTCYSSNRKLFSCIKRTAVWVMGTPVNTSHYSGIHTCAYSIQTHTVTYIHACMYTLILTHTCTWHKHTQMHECTRCKHTHTHYKISDNTPVKQLSLLQ